MKIGIYSDSVNMPSGFGNQTKLLAEGFAKYGHEVEVYGAQAAPNHDNKKFVEHGVSYVNYGLINRIVSQSKPDVFIMFGPPGAHLDFFKTDICRVVSPYIWLAWEQIAASLELGSLLKTLGSKRIVHLSQFGRDMWSRFVGKDHPVIYHGIDLDVFKPLGVSKKELRSKWSAKLRQFIDPDAFLIGVIDRNDIRKRHDLNFDIVSKLINAGHRVQCLIHCKKDDERGYNIEALSKELYGIPSHAIITTDFDWNLGFTLEEINELYNMFDIRLSCCGGEGFGIPSVEAMAAGCVNVVPNNTTFPELIGDAGIYMESAGRMILGKHFLFSATDTNHGVQLIADAMKNKDKLEKLRKIGLETVKKFDQKKIISDWIDLLVEEESDKTQVAKRKRLYEYGIETEKAERISILNISKVVYLVNNEEGSVIDIGCGRGVFTETINRLGTNTRGIDKDANVLDLVTETAKLFCEIPKDILNVDEIDDRYTSALMIDVLHEMTDQEIDKVMGKVKNCKWLFVRVNTTDLVPVLNRVNFKSSKNWIRYIEKFGWFNCPQIVDYSAGLFDIGARQLLIFNRDRITVVPETLKKKAVDIGTKVSFNEKIESSKGLVDNLT